MAKRVVSRYKICFQTKNKVWTYKDSRLRNFYKLRSPIILKQGLDAKSILITKNMKWTVARRFMVPYLKVKSRYRFYYKNIFFTKQQLKVFYGKMQEYRIRNLFKKTFNVALNFKRNVFLGALEQRLNMVIFRMKFLPTIFSCTQFVNHHGILVNEKLISIASYRVKIGDIISISKDIWEIFYENICLKNVERYFGQSMLIWRREFALKKIHYFRLRNRRFFAFHMYLNEKFGIQKYKYLKLKKRLLFLNKKIKKVSSLIKNKKIKNFFLHLKSIFNKIYIYFYKNSLYFLQRWCDRLYYTRKWANPKYLKRMWMLYFYYFHVREISLKVKLYLNKFFLIWNFFRKFILDKVSTKNLEYSSLKIKNYMKNNNLKYLLKLHYNNLIARKSFIKGYKRTKRLKQYYLKTKFTQRIFYLLRRLKYRRLKRKSLRFWSPTVQWYIPSYIEFDFYTLRGVFINYPKTNEVFYSFFCTFPQIISYFKEKAV